MARTAVVAAAIVIAISPALDAGHPPAPPAIQAPRATPPRGTPQSQKATSRIRGRVLAADTGQPLRRVTVRVSSDQLREGRAAMTGDDGRYEISDLPAGRYSLTAERTGFVTLHYGQTRPLEIGQPIELVADRTLDRIDFRLPRGSVIAGRIVDEFGEPVAGARVQLLQFRYVKGQRRLIKAGAFGTTWDTGEFRIWNLLPAEYLVSATPPEPGGLAASNDSAGYAPTYYPGSPNVADAQPVTVGTGETLDGVSITLAPVRLATASGQAIDSRGQPVQSGVVMALQQGASSVVISTSGVIQPDGTFSIPRLAPGKYALRAAAPSATDMPETLSGEVTLNGADVSGVLLQPIRLATIAGHITFEPPAVPPAPSAIRLTVEPKQAELMEFFPARGSFGVADDFTFAITAAPGDVLVSANAPGTPWLLKAVRHRGSDVTDAGLELASARVMEGVEVVMTTRVQEVAGIVKDDQGRIATACTVLAFAQDRERWTAGARFSAMARPDQDGRYALTTLPPGDYFVVAAEYIDDDRRSGDASYLEALMAKATRFTIGEGEARRLDLQVVAAP